MTTIEVLLSVVAIFWAILLFVYSFLYIKLKVSTPKYYIRASEKVNSISEDNKCIGTLISSLYPKTNVVNRDKKWFKYLLFNPDSKRTTHKYYYPMYLEDTDECIGYVGVDNFFWYILFCLILITIVLCMLSTSIQEPKPIQSNSEDISQGELSTMTPEEKKAALQKIVDESAVNISLNVTPSFAATKLNIRYMNREINKSSAVLTISIGDKEIYKSSLVTPGSSIENCTIEDWKPVTEKTEAVVTLDFFTESGEQVNSAVVPITILTNEM